MKILSPGLGVVASQNSGRSTLRPYKSSLEYARGRGQAPPLQTGHIRLDHKRERR